MGSSADEEDLRSPKAPREIPTLPAPPPRQESLDDLMKAALESLEARSRPPAEPARGARTESSERGTAPARPRRAARSSPDKQALEDALRSTLEAFDAGETRPAPARVARPQVARDAPEARVSITPVARSNRPVIVALVAVVAVVGLVLGAWYMLHGSEPVARVEAPPARPAPRFRAPEGDRAGVKQALGVLRDLQAYTKPDLQFRMYFNRVAFARADVERALQSTRDSDAKSALRDVMSLHNLAAAAWRAKTLNEPAKWEAVGDDPAIELCPAARRLLAISDEPPNTTRAQWRGIALAAGVPLLWDCAGERLAEVERGLQ